MRTGFDHAKVMKSVAALRNLQLHSARLDRARADQARRLAEARLEEGRAATHSAEQGWISALGSPVLDPALSRFWLREIALRQGEERELGDALAGADRDADAAGRAAQAAQARSEVAANQAHILARRLMRHREEARLAAVEDQFNARRKQS